MEKAIVKTKEEISLMREGGKILSRVLAEVADMARPGIGTADLDAYAEEKIRKAGGLPAFKGYGNRTETPFPTTLCTSINDEVVHAPAVPNRILKDGDELCIDVGMKYKGFYTDMATTVAIGRIDKAGKKLMDATRESLKAGLKKIRAGADLCAVGKAIGDCAVKKGFFVVKDLTGHGVGRKLHEPPTIPNFFIPRFHFVLEEGMTLAVEPMVCERSENVVIAEDDWTVLTEDGGRAAHFEVTLAVTKRGCEILTPMV